MKKSIKESFEIALTLAIIAGLFMPYIYGVLPIDVIFENAMDFESLFALTIPILVTIPFLLILIFKSALKDSIVRILTPIFLILYIVVLGDYCYGFYDSFQSSIFNDQIAFIISIALSLVLVLLSWKYKLITSNKLKNIMLAIICLPIILYFIYGIINDLDELNYGCYVISIPLISLYFIAVYNIFKNHKLKKAS